jgi:hypothetical protein
VLKPSWGARASTCASVSDDDDADGAAGREVGVPAFLIVGVRDVDGADGLADGAGWVPALIVAACAWNVVETIGQPFPDPLRFCSVTLAALRRASWDAFELSSGKEMVTDGLSRTWPAATFAFRI